MKLEGTVRSEMNQRKTNTEQSYLYVKSEKVELSQSINWWLQGAEVWEKWGNCVKEYKLSVIR